MQPSPSDARVILAGSERAAVTGDITIVEVDAEERIDVTMIVRPRSSAPVAQAMNGAPAARRTFMQREEFVAAFGADPTDVAAVTAFLRGAGLEVTGSDLARRSVFAAGTVAAFETAFGAQLRCFERDGTRYRERVGALGIPANLDGIVLGVFGIDNRPQARPQFRRVRPAAAGNVSYTPLQIAKAYDFPTGDGSGETVALIELGGGFVQSDLDAYFTSLGVRSPKVVGVSVDGASNAPVGDPNSADGEVMLDIEVVGAIAPGATIVVYFAPNTDQGFLDAITTAVHDTVNAPSIVSISWGGPESTWTQQALTNFDAAFADAGTLGVSVFAAAGDNGSSDGVTDGAAHVDFPSSSPNVTACGGTRLTLGASGKSESESVWNDGASGGATGGGISDFFALPSYQAAAGVPPSANAGARVGRGVPDVAGDADPQTGYQTRVDGQSIVVGGTSAVAPLWAALTALGNQQSGKKLGFLNPALYANGATFNDVTSGSNGAYSANSGWDACTGLGTPDGVRLITALSAASSSPAPGSSGV